MSGKRSGGEETLRSQNPAKKEVDFYKQYYTKFSRKYDSHVHERSRIVAECLKSWVDLDHKMILDLGVGTASVWEHLRGFEPEDISVLGIDIAPAMLEIAREKNIAWLNLREDDIERYDDNNQYDLVIASSILKHLPDPSNLVLKIRNFLKDDGELLAEEHTLKDSQYQILTLVTERILDHWTPIARENSFMMSDEDFMGIITRAGLRLKKSEKFSYDQPYGSFEELRQTLIDDTMWGMDYRRIGEGKRAECDTIFLETLRECLEEPTLRRRIFVGLFDMVSSSPNPD